MEWFENIPININNNGDPLVDNTIDDTIEKIKSLEGYGNIVHICTKAVPSEYAFEQLSKLTDNQKKNIFLSYSLTGLDEGGYSFDERVDTIDRLYSMFGNITILLRPVIRGLNDSEENIEKIVKVASKYGNRIIMGGLHNNKLMKRLKDETKEYFISCCEKYGVKYFNKTTCAASDVFNISCKVHDYVDNEPINLEVLNMLGYKYTIWNDKILLEQASSGDLNLIRCITKSIPYTKKLTSRLNRVSSNDDHNYEVTSGWLSWSGNFPCPIGCKYCVMSMIDYLHDGSSVGCHPKDVANIRIDNLPRNEYVDIESLEKYISYKDCRVQQKCLKYGKRS